MKERGDGFGGNSAKKKRRYACTGRSRVWRAEVTKRKKDIEQLVRRNTVYLLKGGRTVNSEGKEGTSIEGTVRTKWNGNAEL